MRTYLDFEKPISSLETQLDELSALSRSGASVSISADVGRLEKTFRQALSELYNRLTPWQKTQVARHPERPSFSAYVDRLVTDFMPLCGDRKFADDQAIQGGIGRLRGHPIVIIGHERGRDTQTRLAHNFGMARPEGYRKAVRLMDLADRFNIPVVSLIDTAGAYPGIDAEERGQAEAIARSTERCLSLGVPSIAVIIGQGGSGGAIALATANRVFMLEHAIYTVASPEASASILWRDTGRAMDAAMSMKVTAQDLLDMGVIDAIIPEPCGGAHRNIDEVVAATAKFIVGSLGELSAVGRDALRSARRQKFMDIGKIL